MNKYFLIIFCCLCLTNLTAQDAAKRTSTDKQISQIDFTETFEDGSSGDGTLSFHALNDATTMANYRFEKTSLPNPYSVDYNYHIKSQEDGSYLIEMGSVLDPLSMRIDDDVEVTYNGDDLEFPGNIEVGTSLKDAKGEYTLAIRKARFALIYLVEVTNRQVIGQETIEVDGETYEAFVITYECRIEKSVNGNTINARAENIKEWYVPGIGAIAKTRTGKSRDKEQTNEINSTLVTNSVSF